LLGRGEGCKWEVGEFCNDCAQDIEVAQGLVSTWSDIIEWSDSHSGRHPNTAFRKMIDDLPSELIDIEFLFLLFSGPSEKLMMA
jgi:hypothetical protein